MQVLADETRVAQWVDQMVDWVDALERATAATSGGGVALVGMRSRGDVLAERVADRLGRERFAGRVGSLDVTLYRDDLSEIGPQPVVGMTEVAFALDGLDVVLLDDVMMTGRSVRAALTALLDLGRPRRVWLGVLADRGGRELPIQPDFAAADFSEAAADHKLKLTIRPLHARDELLMVPDPARAEI